MFTVMVVSFFVSVCFSFSYLCLLYVCEVIFLSYFHVLQDGRMRNRIKNYCVQPKLGGVGLHQGK